MQRSPLGWLDFILPKDGDSHQIAKDIAFGSDPRHRLDLYAPRKVNRDLPVMLFIYGGGWDSGDKSDYSFAGRAYAALGFLTAVADYRLVPEAHYPEFLEDCVAAAKWLTGQAAEFGGNARDLFLAGHSAGAYNAVMLGLSAEQLGAPELSGRIRGVVGIAGPYDFYPFDVPASIAAFSRAEEPELTQPVNLVTPTAPPMFLGHGTSDKLVYPRNTIALARQLRGAGVPVTEKLYEGLGHADTLLVQMRPLRWRSDLFDDVAEFLDELTR